MDQPFNLPANAHKNGQTLEKTLEMVADFRRQRKRYARDFDGIL